MIEAIQAYIDEHKPKPFLWTAKAEDILEKVRGARAGLDMVASESDATLGEAGERFFAKDIEHLVAR